MRKLLATRKSLALAAVLTASALSLAAAPASASPRNALTPDRAFTRVELCDTGTEQLCMAGHDGDNGFITAQPYAAGVAETVNILAASECSGTVEYEPNAKPQPIFCPFADHALDNQYKGDDLVLIQNADNGMYYRAPYDVEVIESSVGDGEVWVQAGDLLAVNGPAGNLINVKATADEDAGQGACEIGDPGDIVSLGAVGHQDGYCAWNVIP